MNHLTAISEHGTDLLAIRPVQLEPSSRYVMGTGSRLFGVAGTSAVMLLILGAAFFTLHSYVTAPPPAALNVFDVRPPAAPPEPVHDEQSEPEQKPTDDRQPVPDQPRITPPVIMVPNIDSTPIAALPTTADPGPAVKEKTIPEAPPSPPAAQPSISKPTWQGLVLGALNKARRYPREARFARQQGVPYIRFTMDREGRVLSVQLERSSGVRSLDREAMALPKRAQPLPKPPEDVKGDTLELVVPVEFFLR